VIQYYETVSEALARLEAALAEVFELDREGGDGTLEDDCFEAVD
jgi:hypothetical protein